MIGSTLLVLASLCQAPAQDPDRLVAQLGATRFAEREDATRSLEKLGRAALPALRGARTAQDLEVRTRAAALISRIEGALLTQPTLVDLNFENRPLPEVMKLLSERAGINLALVPENSPIWAQRRVTLTEKFPVPFWQAVDRLCEAAGLQYNHGGYGGVQSRQPTLAFFDGSVRPNLPRCDSGPFRVSVLTLHYQRDVTFPAVPQRLGQPQAGPRPGGAPAEAAKFGASTTENCYAQLQIAGEPRLSVSQAGTLKIVEAMDDKGQNLVDENIRANTIQRSSGYMGIGGNSAIQLQATLSRPEQPGRSIRSLRGILPVMVSTRKPNPLTFKLDGATGKSFRNEEVAVSVIDQRQLGNTPQTLIELTIQGLATSAGSVGGGLGVNESMIARPDALQQQIEIVDAQGRMMRWYQTNIDLESSRVTLSVMPLNAEANNGPTEVRVYGLARASTEVSFVFQNLPLP